MPCSVTSSEGPRAVRSCRRLPRGPGLGAALVAMTPHRARHYSGSSPCRRKQPRRPAQDDGSVVRHRRERRRRGLLSLLPVPFKGMRAFIFEAKTSQRARRGLHCICRAQWRQSGSAQVRFPKAKSRISWLGRDLFHQVVSIGWRTRNTSRRYCPFWSGR
jgi:hypothetical protein